MLIRRPSSLVVGSSVCLAIMQSTILPAAAFLLSPHHPTNRHFDCVVMDHDCHDAVAMVVMSSSSSSPPHRHGRPLTILGAKSKASADSTTPGSSNTTASSTAATTTTTTTTAWQDLSQAAQDVWTSIRDAPERYKLKQDLILQGASYDRGFGASPVARQKVADMVQELISMNPWCDKDATRHFVGKQRGRENDLQDEEQQDSPLKGTWVLVWTTAQDVLALHASPFTVVGAMYQVVEPPVLTTIVDLIPRAQELVPPDKIRSTLFRGKVKKMGVPSRSAANNKKKKNTLDVTLESFNVKAVEVFGRKTGAALPAWATQIPKLPGTTDNTVLEIAYLDDTMMITKQKAPGGTNVYVKVPNAEV